MGALRISPLGFGELDDKPASVLIVCIQADVAAKVAYVMPGERQSDAEALSEVA